MSCVESREEINESQIKFDSKERVGGQPCIDFQPDDRWQINEDKKESDRTKLNSERRKRKASISDNETKEDQGGKKMKANCSNKSQKKVSQSISNDSTVNGESFSPKSNDELEENRKEKLNNQSKIKDNHCNKPSKRKRKALNSKSSKVIHKEEKLNKKSKIDKCTDSEEVKNNTEQEIDEDSDCNNVMPNLSPATNESVQKESENKDDSIEVIEDKTLETKNGDNKAESESKDIDCEVLPQLDEYKDSVIKDKSKEENKINNDKKKETEIEIISISDDKKSDDSGGESDSEIQIITPSEPEECNTELETLSESKEPMDIKLSAGFPYYNSLKEKIKGFNAGNYKPVKFPHVGTLMLGENEVIIESPSLLVPLLIKEKDEFPKLESEENKTAESTVSKQPMISKRNFFQSSVGQFLINLGMSRVQEWYHKDMMRAKSKQLKSKTSNDKKLAQVVETHTKKYEELKEINSIFNFRLRRCQFCNFKTESRCVMDGHYLIPHLNSRREYCCNFCEYMTRDPKAILFHFEAMHGKKASILDYNIPFHECIFCSFQSHLKTKISAHMTRCRKHFIPSQNLAPPFDFEFPGVTTKPVTITDAVAHRRLLLTSKTRLPITEDGSQGTYARKKLVTALNRMTNQNSYSEIKNPNLMKHLMTSTSQVPLTSSAIHLPPGIVITRPRGSLPQMRPIGRYPQPRSLAGLGSAPRRIFSAITTSSSQLGSSGISITPVTRPNNTGTRTTSAQGLRNLTLTPISTVSNRNVSSKPGPPQPVALFTNVAGSGSIIGQPAARLPVGMSVRASRPVASYQRLNTPPSQVMKGSSGATYVMCEICDSFIKDLEELRSHMNWVHKVKIHPKMLASRPPLNCQKCQWRFFTDQGLERHLLGAHGLVTTNMQEMANKNQDGGRCIICGAVFTYKLVSHMTQVHKVTLKPAHLSYKCTVCTATFTLYRLFESHVYNVHSGSAKRPVEDSCDSPAKKINTDEEQEESQLNKCKTCQKTVEDLQDHIIKNHMKNCSVKLCHIEKCKKCLYSSDEMLVIRMSDFGLEEEDVDDSDEDSDSSAESDDSDDSKEQTSPKNETKVEENIVNG